MMKSLHSSHARMRCGCWDCGPPESAARRGQPQKITRGRWSRPMLVRRRTRQSINWLSILQAMVWTPRKSAKSVMHSSRTCKLPQHPRPRSNPNRRDDEGIRCHAPLFGCDQTRGAACGSRQLARTASDRRRGDLVGLPRMVLHRTRIDIVLPLAVRLSGHRLGQARPTPHAGAPRLCAPGGPAPGPFDGTRTVGIIGWVKLLAGIAPTLVSISQDGSASAA